MTLKKAILLALILLPPLFLIYTATLFTVNVPFWDEWEVPLLFEKYYNGTLTFDFLFSQHNEHRQPFPLLLFLLLSKLSLWTSPVLVALNISTVGFIFFLLGKLSRNTCGESFLLFPLGITSLLLFSLVQHGNWFWGFQVPWFLVNFCLITATYLIHLKKELSLMQLTGAAGACVIASFSLAQGLLSWFALLPSVFLLSSSNRWKYTGLWLTFTAGTWFLYLNGYHRVAGHPDPFLIFQQPLQAFQYFLAMLGSPFTRHVDHSITGGILGLGILLFLLWKIFKIITENKDRAILYIVMPWITLVLFSFGFDLMTTVGRFGFGVSQALSSRYTSLSLMFWIALVQLFFIYQNDSHEKTSISISPKRRRGYYVIRKGSIVWILILLLFGNKLFLNSKESILRASERQLPRIQSNTCLLLSHVYKDLECLKGIYPVPSVVEQRTQLMEKIGLWNLPKSFTLPEKLETQYAQVQQSEFRTNGESLEISLKGTVQQGDFAPVLVSIESGKSHFIQVAHLIPKNSSSSILLPNQPMTWEINKSLPKAQQKRRYQVWYYLKKEERMVQVSKDL